MSNRKKTAPTDKKRGGAGGVILALFLALIVMGGLAGVGGYLFAQWEFKKAGPVTADAQPRVVMIDPGSSVQTIANKLVAAGAIGDDLPFRLAVRLEKASNKLRAGEYAVASGASVNDIIALLKSGKSILHPVTIPEGLTTGMILRKLQAETILTGDLPQVEPAEGVLLPDTYMVQRGETREAVIQRMITAQNEVMQSLWANRQPGLPIDTPQEALILASVVEKETGIAEERPKVAAVFVNRLKRGIRLESDPTIIYGLTKGEPLGRGLRKSELARENKWNTYQIDGLPPTPICNPGREALAAVLNPPPSEDLFFVADGSGGHVFAPTYAEHLRNVANWRKVEAAAATETAPAAASTGTKAPKPAPKSGQN